MALIEETLLGTVDKVQIAIERLKAFEPSDGYWIAFSGGKDSVVIKRLAQMAGVKFDAHYSVTSVDPPELVRFIKDVHPDVSFDIPRYKDGTAITMWNLIPKKLMPPSRLVRYCCASLKESNGMGHVVVTGVRWAESASRKNNKKLINISTKNGRNRVIFNDDNEESRRAVELCYRTKKTMINPIIDWSDEDVWEFISTFKVKYCELYAKGYKRLGCIGCPMNTNADKELNAYPKQRMAYIRAFERMLGERKVKGLETSWTTGEKVMDWWLHGGSDNDELTLLDGYDDDDLTAVDAE